MTANSFTSISLSPPMVLVSVKQGRTLDAVRHTGKLGINVLPASAKELSGHFAGRPVSGLEPAFEQAGDMPKLARAIAYFSCDLERVIEVADHTLLIGAVRDCSYQDAAEPLVFFSSEYRELGT